ncbi:hypothetical protein [Streptomyces sp. col6]|uniref:hypothetical protein n=1 Tax=Streptomyces sp. col6 TaxID=2478958 RepID=UPI0011CDD0C3|nr:hypothetical protein [Streptomyces sp. col6]
MTEHPLPKMEIWHPHVHPSTPSGYAELDMHLVAISDSIPFDPSDDQLANLALQLFGIPSPVSSWELAEFASPYYGEDPISEALELRIGRAWSLSVGFQAASAPNEHIATTPHPRVLSIPDTVRRSGALRPLTELPLIAMADSSSRPACEAAAKHLPDETVASTPKFEGYTQLRVVIETYPGTALDALDEFVDLCDRYELNMSWREFISLVDARHGDTVE